MSSDYVYLWKPQWYLYVLWISCVSCYWMERFSLFLNFCDSPVICDNGKWLLLSYFKLVNSHGSLFSGGAVQKGLGQGYVQAHSTEASRDAPGKQAASGAHGECQPHVLLYISDILLWTWPWLLLCDLLSGARNQLFIVLFLRVLHPEYCVVVFAF